MQADQDIIEERNSVLANYGKKKFIYADPRIEKARARLAQDSEEIALSERAYLEWKDICYYVPAKTASRTDIEQAEIDIQKGLPPKMTRQFEHGKVFKQIVHSSSGYVAPQEMVAILGPSGSGKTSLLNVLSQRTFLMPGGRAEGQVTINGEQIGKGDYAKLGAYVQQDDILVDVLTPRELLEFACQMRTSYETKAEI